MVVIGNAASGEDISRDIAQVAKEVHISGRTWGSPVDFGEPVDQHSNIYRHSTVTSLRSEISVLIEPLVFLGFGFRVVLTRAYGDFFLSNFT